MRGQGRLTWYRLIWYALAIGTHIDACPAELREAVFGPSAQTDHPVYLSVGKPSDGKSVSKGEQPSEASAPFTDASGPVKGGVVDEEKFEEVAPLKESESAGDAQDGTKTHPTVVKWYRVHTRHSNTPLLLCSSCARRPLEPPTLLEPSR